MHCLTRFEDLARPLLDKIAEGKVRIPEADLDRPNLPAGLPAGRSDGSFGYGRAVFAVDTLWPDLLFSFPTKRLLIPCCSSNVANAELCTFMARIRMLLPHARTLNAILSQYDCRATQFHHHFNDRLSFSTGTTNLRPETDVCFHIGRAGGVWFMRTFCGLRHG